MYVIYTKCQLDSLKVRLFDGSFHDVDSDQLSFEMLIDRPKGKPKVLQGTFDKKDPEAFDDPDFMKAEGGVVEMKDKAVNMYRGTQGIEPFIKYMV